jgi:hypothetical protein
MTMSLSSVELSHVTYYKLRDIFEISIDNIINNFLSYISSKEYHLAER